MRKKTIGERKTLLLKLLHFLPLTLPVTGSKIVFPLAFNPNLCNGEAVNLRNFSVNSPRAATTGMLWGVRVLALLDKKQGKD
jgi:hypothetical protein